MSSREANESIENPIEEKGEEEREEKERCCAFNKVYLVSKGFYIFFFAAQGSLLPYLALFFKQLELPANQIGVITGLKPYIAFFFIPFWGCFADRFKKGKLLFVISMVAVILGMVAYALIPIDICETKLTDLSKRYNPNIIKHRVLLKRTSHTSKYEPIDQQSLQENPLNYSAGDSSLRNKRLSNISELISHISPKEESTEFAKLKKSDGIALSSRHEMGSLDGLSEMADTSIEETPWSQSDMIAFQDQKRQTVKERNSSIFLYLLLATILSTMLSCPSLTLADTATVNLLKRNDETHKYGKQRLWGSVGYGSMAFLIGAAISRTHLCPPGSARRKDVNYYPCFVMYIVYNTIALVIGTRFDFNNGGKKDNAHKDTPGAAQKDDAELPRSENKTNTNGKAILAGLKLLTRPKHAVFIATAFYVGITMGFIRVFLFWHLKDIGGTQILFSIMTAVNCVAEVTLYFLSTKLIAYMGAVRVLYLGLICYSIRLFYYAIVSNPWTVLPVELLSGITTAAVWAAMMSYVGTHSVEGASVTLQGE